MKGNTATSSYALAAGIVAISFGAIFARLADGPAPAVAALRMIFSSLILLPVALGSGGVRRELGSLSSRDRGLLALSGAFLALHFILWISSLSFTGITSSVVFVTTSPLWVALWTVAFRRERLPRIFWIGLALALAGGLMIGGGGLRAGGGRWRGDLLAVAGAVAVAGYFIVGSSLRRRLSLVGYVFPVYSVAAVMLLSASLFSGAALAGCGWRTYLFTFLMAAVCQIIGHSSFNFALRHIAATAVAIAALGEPAGASLLALVVFGETPLATEVIGGAAILLGIVLVLSSRPERSGGASKAASGL